MYKPSSYAPPFRYLPFFIEFAEPELNLLVNMDFYNHSLGRYGKRLEVASLRARLQLHISSILG